MANGSSNPVLRWGAIGFFAAGLSLFATSGFGQILNRQVGGVFIDAHGLVTNVEQDQRGELRRVAEKALHPVPGELQQPAALRKISLRRLEAAVKAQLDKVAPLSDEMKYLAGLQRIQYVFVYPERHDIVLAGPGEGWKLNDRGEMVGAASGRPVLLLDDLLVALRSTEEARKTAIICSIDPTAAGLSKLQVLVKQLHAMTPDTLPAIEQTLGPQVVTITGVPESSHFAGVIVAADYKMKRLAMNFDPAPVKGMPSFMELIKAGRRGMQNMLPRWWLAPRYDALLTSADGLAWELRGSAVQTMTEEDFVSASGERKHTGKASPVAKKWADSMTAHYDELTTKDAVFGELRNCMDLAVVAALIAKENLTEKAGCSLSVLLRDKAMPIEEANPPRQLDTKASVLRKGQGWVISASGGVQIDSWKLVEKSEPSDKLAPLREQAASESKQWWWN